IVLGPAQAKVKHVILLTDGQASYEGIAELVDEMRQSRITVSAVGIGEAAEVLAYPRCRAYCFIASLMR
ncbi:MAG TPA: VWA domain-containing protein, partial [Polyangiaceae bacterium]|nr:VWA domain-containing protein [Polyangiaceae bacterium]